MAKVKFLQGQYSSALLAGTTPPIKAGQMILAEQAGETPKLRLFYDVDGTTRREIASFDEISSFIRNDETLENYIINTIINMEFLDDNTLTIEQKFEQIETTINQLETDLLLRIETLEGKMDDAEEAIEELQDYIGNFTSDGSIKIEEVDVTDGEEEPEVIGKTLEFSVEVSGASGNMLEKKEDGSLYVPEAETTVVKNTDNSIEVQKTSGVAEYDVSLKVAASDKLITKTSGGITTDNFKLQWNSSTERLELYGRYTSPTGSGTDPRELMTYVEIPMNSAIDYAGIVELEWDDQGSGEWIFNPSTVPGRSYSWPEPDFTGSANDGKYLALIFLDGGGVPMAAYLNLATLIDPYTEGDGINIVNNEISVDLATGGTAGQKLVFLGSTPGQKQIGFTSGWTLVLDAEKTILEDLVTNGYVKEVKIAEDGSEEILSASETDGVVTLSIDMPEIPEAPIQSITVNGDEVEPDGDGNVDILVPVLDVQIAGSSIVDADGEANIPLAGESEAGVVKLVIDINSTATDAAISAKTISNWLDIQSF